MVDVVVVLFLEKLRWTRPSSWWGCSRPWTTGRAIYGRAASRGHFEQFYLCNPEITRVLVHPERHQHPPVTLSVIMFFSQKLTKNLLKFWPNTSSLKFELKNSVSKTLIEINTEWAKNFHLCTPNYFSIFFFGNLTGNSKMLIRKKLILLVLN